MTGRLSYLQKYVSTMMLVSGHWMVLYQNLTADASDTSLAGQGYQGTKGVYPIVPGCQSRITGKTDITPA